jgi:hypothetical protein
MSGLMRRLTRGRAATDDEATPQASAASEPVSATPDAQQGGSGMPANGVPVVAGEEPKPAVLAGGDGAEPKTEKTAVLPPVAGPGAEDSRDLPAGVDPARLAAVPSSARRGRLRRRLRYLRAVRELLLRDIGGFYYEAQRSDSGIDPHQRHLDAKTARLTRLDEEMRELETRLDEAHPQTILRQPGLGGTCPHCGELHGSDARYCSRCGAALSGRAARARLAAPTGPAPRPTASAASAGDDSSKATTASLWGRPKRAEPAPAAPDDATHADAAKPVAADEAKADEAQMDKAEADEAKADDAAAPTGSERS